MFAERRALAKRLAPKLGNARDDTARLRSRSNRGHDARNIFLCFILCKLTRNLNIAYIILYILVLCETSTVYPANKKWSSF